MAENLAHLISTSLGFGAVIALLLLLRRALDGRFAPTWWRQVWTWLLVVMFLYLPARSFLTAVIPSPIELDTPQVVVDGAYDRYNAFLWDDEKIVAAGGGGAGGAMTTTEDGNMWYRHYVHYEDAQGQDVTIRDNDYLRSVTVGETTTYTVHWTGVAYLVYAVAAVLLFVGGLVRYRLFRRRCLRWSTPAEAEDLAALEEQKQALGLEREVELYRCPRGPHSAAHGLSPPGDSAARGDASGLFGHRTGPRAHPPEIPRHCPAPVGLPGPGRPLVQSHGVAAGAPASPGDRALL